MKLSKLMLLAILAFAGTARAEDIDLFEGGTDVTGTKPNVLIILDNTANWSRASEWNSTDIEATQGAAQVRAISEALSVLSADVRIGIMMQSQSGSTSGGYVRFGLRDLTTTNRTALTSVLAGIKPNVNDPSEKVSQSSYSGAMREAYQYFSNLSVVGPTDGKRDYTGNGGWNTSPYTAGSLTGNPLSNSTDTTYTGPLNIDEPCGKNYIIFIGNEWNNTTDTEYGLTGLGGSATAIYTANGGSNHYGDEWARFLKQNGAVAPCNGDETVCANGKVVTYTINVCYKTCVSNPSLGVEQEALLKSMAAVGGGRYFRSTSMEEIKTALTTIFNEVQAVNSVFTSASLPVSVNTQGTYLNQIYMGVFRPDAGGQPRWLGNLKQYKFGLTTDALGQDQIFLSDADGVAAVNSQTGFINESARSYWSTTVSPPGFWAFNPFGDGGQYDAPDGDHVEKGAAAFQLRSHFVTSGGNNRNVLTCTPACTAGSSPSQFSTSNASLLSTLSGSTSSVSLSRSGTTVTATTSSALGLSDPTDTVSISAATVADFNGTYTVNKVSDTSFTFTISETPATPATGSAMTAASSSPVSSSLAGNMTFSSGTVSVYQPSHGFVSGQSVTVSGAGVSAAMGTATAPCSGWPSTAACEYNGTFAINVVDADHFTYSPPNTNFGATSTGSVVSPPATFSTSYGSVTIGCKKGSGSTSYTLPITSMSRVAGTGTKEVTVAANAASALSDCSTPLATGSGAGKITSFSITGGNVANDIGGGYTLNSITGTNGSGSKTFKFNVTVTSTPNPAVYFYPASPATGSITLSGLLTRAVASIARTDGNTATVTVTTVLNHGFANGNSITIAGADQSEYNGAHTISDASGKIFKYTIATGPATTATGTAGRGSAIDATTLINWVRGVDNKEDENANGVATDVRASIHGDVLHSRPLVINYGGTTGVYAFYGANDGTFHAVKGGQDDSNDGDEQWAFVAPEHYAALGRLYSNVPLINYPGTPETLNPTPSPRNYFFDGNIGVYQSADLATTHLFIAMRRGGRFIYALDVSDPEDPKYLWKKSNTDTGMSELGQTWSEPKVFRLKKTSGVDCSGSDESTFTRGLVFGAGYDATEEDKANQGSPDVVRNPTMGRGVFILNATNGNLIKLLQPTDTKKYSFPSETTLMDTDGDGCIDRIYAVDTGANIWRFEIGDANSDNWNTYKIAALGDIGDNGGTDDRKFLYPPDAVNSFISGSPVTYLMVGSGNREKPLDENIEDGFFMVKDTITSVTEPEDVPTCPDADNRPCYPVVKSALEEITEYDPEQTEIDATDPEFRGWFLDYLEGEKSVNAPLTVAGVTFFGTNQPKAADTSNTQQCQPNLGIARGYALNFLDATAVYDRDLGGEVTQSDLYTVFKGGGLPPSAVSGVVQIDEKTVRFIIGGGGEATEGSTIEGAKLQANPNSSRTRTFWYFEKD